MFPDVEVLLVAYLAAADPSARVLTDLPDDLESVLPVWQVRRVSGADRDYKLDRPIVDIDTWAADRTTAAQRAHQAHALLRGDLPHLHAVQPSGVVTSVETIAGPRWLPDPNTNLRRYSASYEICVHAPPAADAMTS